MVITKTAMIAYLGKKYKNMSSKELCGLMNQKSFDTIQQRIFEYNEDHYYVSAPRFWLEMINKIEFSERKAKIYMNNELKACKNCGKTEILKKFRRLDNSISNNCLECRNKYGKK